MSASRTALDHLLDGREALVLEVARLTTALAELDTVITRLGGAGSVNTRGTGSGGPGGATALVPTKPVSETVKSGTRPQAATAGAAKQAPKVAGRRAAANGTGGKSIRVHVLELLGSQNRAFDLAEIIDRIHQAGVQAHDDAVRSITIKLMKDGQVERVGRGQYRLAGHRSDEPSATVRPAGPSTTAPHMSPRTGGPISRTPPLNLAQPWQPPAS